MAGFRKKPRPSQRSAAVGCGGRPEVGRGKCDQHQSGIPGRRLDFFREHISLTAPAQFSFQLPITSAALSYIFRLVSRYLPAARITRTNNATAHLASRKFMLFWSLPHLRAIVARPSARARPPSHPRRQKGLREGTRSARLRYCPLQRRHYDAGP